MRDEILNECLFMGLDHARTKIATWADDYNQRRPHSALGSHTPAAYAANLAATCDRRGSRHRHHMTPHEGGTHPISSLHGSDNLFASTWRNAFDRQVRKITFIRLDASCRMSVIVSMRKSSE